MSFAEFVEKWAHYQTASVTPAALDGAEQRLGTLLPAAYRAGVLALGAPSTRVSLLKTIVDQDIDIADVQDFFPPFDIVRFTEEWRTLGLPQDLIAFASDCSGNLFCFKTEASQERPQDAPVWLWNHEVNRARRVASSFEDWIAAFCRIARPAPRS